MLDTISPEWGALQCGLDAVEAFTRHLTTVCCSQVTSRVSFVLFDFADAPEVYKRSKAEGFKIDQNCWCSRESRRRGRDRSREREKEGWGEGGWGGNINYECVAGAIHRGRK